MITPFLWSGAGKAIVRLLMELRDRRFECEIVSSGRSRGLSDWPEYVRAIRGAGIPYHCIDFFDREHGRVWQSIRQLADLLQNRRYDLVHVHAGVPAFAASVVRDCLNADFALVATFHSWNPLRPAWMNVADVWALNRCDRVITVSSSYQKELESWGLIPDRSETICFGADLPPERRRRRSGPFRILSLGRIEPRKDPETLLRGFSIFHREFPHTELCVVGPAADQGYGDRMMAKAVRHSWNRGVRFLGKVPDPGPWYRKADMFVSTSTDEGLGLSLLEAMSHGLPAACTAVNGHSEYARDRVNALVFPPGNHELLAASMREIFLDESLRNRLSANARDTVARSFTWSQVIDKYLHVYCSLPGKQNPKYSLS